MLRLITSDSLKLTSTFVSQKFSFQNKFKLYYIYNLGEGGLTIQPQSANDEER